MKHLVSYHSAPTKGSRSKRPFQNSLRRLIYPYQLHVDNLVFTIRGLLVVGNDAPWN